MTSLHFAASEGHTDVVLCLLNRGANIGATDRVREPTWVFSIVTCLRWFLQICVCTCVFMHAIYIVNVYVYICNSI